MPAGEIRALTALRFGAALLVFLFHIHIRWPMADGFVGNVLSQGAIGMSVFFTLSGFVLAHANGEAVTNLKDYFLKRFARIYPVYVLAALVTLPWLLTPPGAEGPVAHALPKTVALLGADSLLVQAWFPQMFDYWNNGASWSISVEAFFYALFPTLLPLIARRSTRTLLLIAAGAYALSILPAAIYVAFDPKPEPALPIFYAMPIFRLPEFVIGICTCCLARRWRPLFNLDVLMIAAVAGLIGYLGVIGSRAPLYVGQNWIVVPVMACLLFGLAKPESLIHRAMQSQNPITDTLAFLGRASYCFYSFQALILWLMLSKKDLMPSNPKIVAVGAFTALLAVSSAAFWWIEHPLERGIKRRGRRLIAA